MQGSAFVFRQVFFQLIRLAQGKSHKLGYYHEEEAKTEFAVEGIFCVVFIFCEDFELHA